MNHREAVELMKQGQETGFEYLYKETYNKCYYIVWGILGNEQTALDAIQDGYIKAYQNIDKLQDPEKFIPWMKSIARHKALDYKKLNKKDLFREAKDEE